MKIQLSLRQNKIIQTLRNNRAFMTSDEISRVLNVSSKTIRTDINDLNNILAGEGIRIDSVKGKGFILCAENQELLKNLTKDNNVFLSQADRVYYLAVRLCCSDEPINFFDLEDEIAVSSSTLSSDLNAFKNRFVHNVPYINLHVSKNELLLEDDERKKRFILKKLLTDNWDYYSTGNVYYESDFIDSEAFESINSLAAQVLYKHGVHMDDYSLISLNIYLSITFHRLTHGHPLNVPVSDQAVPEEISDSCRELFEALRTELDFVFPKNEIAETAHMIAENRLHHLDDFKAREFPTRYYDIASDFLCKVNDIYGLELRDDDELYDRLLSFIAHLFHPMKDLTVRDSADHIKHHLFVEFDVSLLMCEVIGSDCVITENDLLYLAWLISGSFFSYYHRNSGAKFKTIVLSHMSTHSMWSLKLALQNLFGGYLDIADVIPVYQKDLYDFSDVKLILTTVNKQISGFSGRQILQISPYLSRQDSYDIINQIRDLKIQQLYPQKIFTVQELLDDAYVHEKMTFSSQYDLIEYICQDFLGNGIFTQEHVSSIMKRESVASFAVNPALLLLYSPNPSAKTKMSVLTLEHRIIWNRHKIRIVFLVSLAAEDTNELFYLQNVLFHQHFDPDMLKNIKTLDELTDYYSDCD